MTENSLAVLDVGQLRDISLDDRELMREIVSALIDDTRQQIPLLDLAIRDEDSQRCARLAHYSKGACANVGAQSAAALLKALERQAGDCQFQQCSESLAALARELERLQVEAQMLA